MSTAAVLILLSMLAACSASQAPGGGGRLSIATGGTGGSTSSTAGHWPTRSRRTSKGGGDRRVNLCLGGQLQLIADESSDVAFTLADTAADAVEGRESFDGEPVPAQALALLYNNYTQVVTTAGSGIESIEDLQGKSVSVGSPGSGTEVIALRVLDAAGLDPDADIDRQQLGVDESVDAVRDGTIDAFFWPGGLPTGAVTDLATTDQIVLLPTTEYIGTLRERYGEVYQEATIPAAPTRASIRTSP